MQLFWRLNGDELFIEQKVVRGFGCRGGIGGRYGLYQSESSSVIMESPREALSLVAGRPAQGAQALQHLIG
jgi:hypothetical protein